jgi:hypothetical protein
VGKAKKEWERGNIMKENKIDVIEAYDEKVRYIFLITLFLSERSLKAEFEEWVLEKTLDFNIRGRGGNDEG